MLKKYFILALACLPLLAQAQKRIIIGSYSETRNKTFKEVVEDLGKELDFLKGGVGGIVKNLFSSHNRIPSWKKRPYYDLGNVRGRSFYQFKGDSDITIWLRPDFNHEKIVRLHRLRTIMRMQERVQ